MILEVASFRIQSAQGREFEAAYREASKVIAAARGYIRHELRRSVEDAGHYLLFVEWQSIEDHMVGFRESPLFIEWRRLLGPFFSAPPEMEHYEEL